MGIIALAALLPANALSAPSAPTTERALEAVLLDVPTAQGTLDNSTIINQQMHYAGSPGDYALAVWMRDRLRDYGFDATIERFTAEVFTPKKLALQLMSTPRIDFDLHEAAIATDPDGSRRDAGLPFNAGSGNGDVTATVVDAGHGLDDDYRAMRKSGVDVAGKIALIRYGKQFRGLLAHRAQQYGAAGVIFFSDPADEPRGAAYPNGPNRPPGAVQRGSVGSPYLQIPTLPVSALVAGLILQSMRGGQSLQAMHLVVEMSRKVVTLWNTVGTIVGSDPREMVVLGGHRDAWVYGVTDNGSGISTLLEAARALGYLHRSGWQPQRSIVIAGFDGEEIGEAGSNAYVRTHARELTDGCIAYINADEITTGQTFGADAVAALAWTVPAAASSVRDPHTERQTLIDRWHAQPGGAIVGIPGGGSDFESFLYDSGIPTMEVGFSGSFGVYHSAYDDLTYATTYADAGFVNHRAVAQLLALFGMRFAEIKVLPYRFAPYAGEMRRDLETLALTARDPAELGAIEHAVDRFARVAARFDARPDASRNAAALRAVRSLDRVLYGRNGYAAVAFPDAAAAAGTGGATLAAAAARTSAAIDAVTANLR
jgi:N-acetylated-alpha-linked acidic dipeptidase